MTTFQMRQGPKEEWRGEDGTHRLNWIKPQRPGGRRIKDYTRRTRITWDVVKVAAAAAIVTLAMMGLITAMTEEIMPDGSIVEGQAVASWCLSVA